MTGCSGSGPPIALLRSLRDRIVAAVEPLVAGAGSVAVLPFPTYANVGDSAIWLGQHALLQRLGVRIGYAADHISYSSDRLRRAVPDGPIVLSGGGNLGDTWPALQALRMQVIADFGDRPIIQLPQSMQFSDPATAQRAAGQMASHPSFTLFLRDEASMVAAGDLGLDAHLLPDVAFMLQHADRWQAPEVPILWLGRTDPEQRHAAPQREDVEVRDWDVEGMGSARRLDRLTTVLMSNRALRSSVGRSVAPRLYGSVARRRVEGGIGLLQRGRVLVTDRLHGHILAVSLGIPHVLLDTRFGKVHALHRTWTARSGLALEAADTEEAVRHAGALLRAAQDLAPGREEGGE